VGQRPGAGSRITCSIGDRIGLDHDAFARFADAFTEIERRFS
jgi:hypothetical protein